MKTTSTSKAGKIPILIILILALAGAGGGFLLFGKFRDSVGNYLFVLIMGIIIGLFVLPNLKGLIKWWKGVRNEIKE